MIKETIKEPNPPFEVEIIDTEPTKIKNPYSGQSCVLQPTAIAVYDCIKGAEMLGNSTVVREGCDWFMEHYPEEYSVLLD